MRHENINKPSGIDALDVAAVWPDAASFARDAGMARDGLAAPSAPDVPVSVGALIAGAYATLLGALALATVAPGPSLFVIAIAAFFLFMFFMVPATFFGVENMGATRAQMSEFWKRGIDTQTGHSTAGEALVQMLVVPSSLLFGVACMGIAIAWIL